MKNKKLIIVIAAALIVLILPASIGVKALLNNQDSNVEAPEPSNDHTHTAATEPQTATHDWIGYCGNIQTTIHFKDGKKHTFEGGDSVYLTELLSFLDYDQSKLCKCLPDYTVELETGEKYGISTGESGYARCQNGQADLTAEQSERVKQIIESAKEQAI